MLRRLMTPALCLLLSAGLHAAPSEWDLDKAHSTIGFSVRHLGISKVRGKFRDFDAEVVADSETGRLVSISATVQVGSVDTGIQGRDDHLKKDDFFNAAEFPEMKLVTRNLRFVGDELSAMVDLTIRGKTRPVRFTGEFLGAHAVDFGGGKKLRAGYEARARIDRKQFGLSFGRIAEGVAVVSDQVEILLEVELVAK